MRAGEISARGKPTDAIIAQYLANVRVYIRRYICGLRREKRLFDLYFFRIAKVLSVGKCDEFVAPFSDIFFGKVSRQSPGAHLGERYCRLSFFVYSEKSIFTHPRMYEGTHWYTRKSEGGVYKRDIVCLQLNEAFSNKVRANGTDSSSDDGGKPCHLRC